MTKMDFDGLDFKVRIGVDEIVDVHRRKLNVMTNKDGKATPATTDTISTKECIARKRRIRIVLAEFCLLDACNLNIVFV